MSTRSIASLAVLSFCVTGALGWAVGGRTFTGGPDPWLDSNGPVAARHPVVVAELFTSEGCSSCPPADDVLSRLVSEPLDGTVVLGLGEHVDYWDRLGWRDPFSSPAFSSRQTEYQRDVFRTAGIYTPQIVIDGQFEAVGSDVAAVRRAIARAARIPKASIDVAVSPSGDGQLSVHVRIDPPSAVVRERADVVIAITGSHLTSDVRRGENRGRTLTHSAVARDLTALGSIASPGQAFDTTVTVPRPPAWNSRDIRVIALLQERLSRRIVGAGSALVQTTQRRPRPD